MKIFIVDDSSLVCERLKGILAEYPELEVVGQAENAQDAINSIQKLKPDAITLDIRMPGKSGIDVLESVKKIHSTLRIIVLTNYPYLQYEKKCLQLGADYFFDKSTEFYKVVDVLKEINQEIYEKEV